MKYYKKLVVLIYLVCSTMIIQAQTPSSISIQGTLLNARGEATADGPYEVEFRLYDMPTGGVANWTEIATVESVGGIYSHYLGSNTSLLPDVFEKTQYLGIKVGSYEIEPRTLLTYAPYTFASSSAFEAQKVLCSGAVGDVKYSMLSPAQFSAENGACWVPMDGRNIFGKKLATIMGWTTVPNASGMFFRAHEYTDGQDPDRTPSSPIASVQGQLYAAHNHTGSTNPGGDHTHTVGNLVTFGTPTPTGLDASANEVNMTVVGTSSTSTSGAHTHAVTIANNTGTETRPKNLNLYAYIRVD
jgi:hypothetical protein